MQSLIIFLTPSYLYCQSQSPEIQLSKTFIEFPLNDTSPLNKLADYFKEQNLPRNTVITIVLDQKYISYYYFKLPPITKRKINKILEFELSDTLISDIEDYYYDYDYVIEKDTETRIGVYLISKETLHQIIQLGKANNLEIRWILAQDNLMDLYIRNKYKPKEDICVTLEKNWAKAFVYKRGFLIGCSHSSLKKVQTEDFINGSPFDDINWKIKAICSHENQQTDLILDNHDTHNITISENNELLLAENGISFEISDNYIPKIEDIIKTGRHHPINLLKSNMFIFQEIKKHLPRFIMSAITISFALIFYVSTLVYENMVNRDYYQQLSQTYDKTVEQYLPKGTSKNNAITILKNNVSELKETREKNKRFTARDYAISTQLSQLSALKQKVISLKITRFFMADQSIRIQGEVGSIADYEVLKQNLEEIYPPKEYSTKFNQKSLGEEIVQFSATVRLESK